MKDEDLEIRFEEATCDTINNQKDRNTCNRVVTRKVHDEKRSKNILIILLVSYLILGCFLIPILMKRNTITNNDEEETCVTCETREGSFNGTVDLYLSDFVYSSNITITNGSIWNLKDVDNETLDFIMRPKGSFYFTFQLSDISQNLSCIKSINWNFTMSVNSTNSFIFKSGYVDATTMFDIHTALHNTIGNTSYINWMYPLVGGFHFTNITDANMTLLDPVTGAMTVWLELPRYWEPEDYTISFDHVVCTCYVEGLPWEVYDQFYHVDTQESCN